MKTSLLFFTNLIFLLISSSVNAADIYAEYTMTGVGNKPIISKIYSKNGDLRTESTVDIGGKKMTSVSLMLKSKPNVALVFNSLNKTYTEVKATSSTAIKNFDVKVLGNEKIGNYNCTHVRMSSEGKSWDMWYTKDLPTFSFQMSGNDAAANQKMIAQLKSKGITGMPVKIAFLNPKTSTSSMTMLLTKFEQKTLATSLFAVPAGYKKSSVSFDAEKMKNMTPEQRKEMIIKMMKEQSKQK